MDVYTVVYQCLCMSNVLVSGCLQNLNIPSNISLSLNCIYVTYIIMYKVYMSVYTGTLNVVNIN